MKRFYVGFSTTAVLTELCITDAALFFLFACGFVATIIGLISGLFVSRLSSQRSPVPAETRHTRVRVLVVFAAALFIGLAAGLAVGLLREAALGGIVFILTIWAGLGAISSVIAPTSKRQFLLGMATGFLPCLYLGAFWILGFLFVDVLGK